MKTISIILLVAAVIQITLTAPASDVPTTTITPLGPMDMDQLVEYYKNSKFHRYDVIAPDAIRLIKAFLEKLDDIIASPDNSDAETAIYQEFRSQYADYLKDIEADTTECSLKQLMFYYHHHIKDFIRSVDNDKIRDLFKSFDDQLNVPYGAIGHANLDRTFDNRAMLEELEHKVKFSTRCCKYWHKSYYKDLINGTC